MKPSGAIVSLTAVLWDFPLIGRTRMLTEAWHAVDQPALFIEPPHSYRSVLRAFADRIKGRPAAAPHIIRPWPARYPARWWTRMDERRLRKMLHNSAIDLRRRLERHGPLNGATAIVVSPIWLPWLEKLPFGRVIYDCIDDLAVHAPDADRLRLFQRWEKELIDRCNAIVVTAEELRTHVTTIRPNVRVETIRNGVDVDRFQNAAAQSPTPGDLPTDDRPIIGFVGALYEWIDFDLIRRAAEELPQAHFVLVGPDDQPDDIESLRRLPNISLLGPRPYAQVPAYVNRFDICWVPFKTGRIAAAANPVKIYEYLALAKPVVTTPVADTASFGDLVRVGSTHDEIIAHLTALTADPRPTTADAESRIAFARRNSWQQRAAQYTELIASLDQSN